MRDTIDDTLDWLMAKREQAFERACKATGQEREDLIEEASIFAHAHSLIFREYRPHQFRAKVATPTPTSTTGETEKK